MITIAALNAIHREAEWQEVDAAAELRLIRAFATAYRWAYSGEPEPSALSVFGLMHVLEPDAVASDMFRQTPVTFASGMSAVPPESVPRAFDSLFRALPGIEDRDVDAWLKSLLEIHPFRDGNGRLAWLLRVWLFVQWDRPQPLPNFDFVTGGLYAVKS